MTRDQIIRGIRKTTCTLALPALIFGLGHAALAAGEEAAPAEEKALIAQVVPKKLQVSLTPSKSAFQVGEPISFSVKGNQEFFLYLFSVNAADDRGLLVLPNDLDTGNKYPAGQAFKVPNPGLELVADRPGSERIIMVASTRYLQLDTGSYQRVGKFMAASAKAVEDEVKGLRVRSGSAGGDMVVQELTVDVSGRASGGLRLPGMEQSASKPAPMVFVSADRTSYQEGEPVRVIFGADAPGWVSIFVEQPNGERVLLKKQEVSGQGYHQLQAVAERPAGSHVLVARFTKSEPPAKAAAVTDKGLRLTGDEAGEYAETVFQFQIR